MKIILIVLMLMFTIGYSSVAMGKECTDLIKAIHQGNVDIIKNLLDDGCDINSKDKFDWTALMNAAGKENTEIAILLIERGANLTRGANLAIQH